MNAPPKLQDPILDLHAANEAPLYEVGGKALPLAELSRLGFTIPPGIVLLASAPLTEDTRVRLEIATQRLGEGPFAVRSSAASEDGATRSYAGQFETILNVAPSDVWEAVLECRESARGVRALTYAGGEIAEIGVIVQQMVKAESAGVAFSANPQTGARDVCVIEAVQGLGDRLVSGEADAECWHVKEAASPTRVLSERVLDEDRAREIADLARRVEKERGCPQDIEWAVEGGELYLLQARPITALPAKPIPIELNLPEGRWDRDDHHGVISPLGWDWFQPYAEGMGAWMKELGVPLKRIGTNTYGGWLYLQFDMSGGDAIPPNWVLWLASRLIPAMRRGNRIAQEFIDQDGYLEDARLWRSTWRDAYQAELEQLDHRNPERLSNDELLSKIQDVLNFTARGLTLHARLHGPGMVSHGKLAVFIHDELGWPMERAFELTAGFSEATTRFHAELTEVIESHRAEIGEDPLPKSWPELTHKHPELAQKLREWLDRNRLHMLHYDPKHPTLGERPEMVLPVVAGILASQGSKLDAAKSATALAEEAEALLPADKRAEFKVLLKNAIDVAGLRDENGIAIVSKPAGLLRHFVLELGRRIEHLIGQKEFAVYLKASEHRAALTGQLDVAAIIEERRGQESWALQNRPPKRLGPPNPPSPPLEPFPAPMARMLRIFEWIDKLHQVPEPSEDAERLTGIGVGTREVTGTARVLNSPEELSSIRAGEIAVCRITSPEWSIGLGIVSAIVTDEGALLSHPAVIAREYGIPAVLGTEYATRKIHTGDRLLVDPIAGTVIKLGS